MKVTLATHGGLAAGIRRQPHIVDSVALPEPSAQELGRLVAALKATPAVEEETPGRARDAMSYTITIEENGGEPLVLRQSDITMSSAFSALLQWIESHSAAS
jgi:hypothetical protein